ncbi:hypothetical protein FNF27_07612 [Cafeteria roenbergensis]|uniref:Uncharacterized protein n=1 Tax=Cafeteria roenbergensis TaxID=33653 RepID=A0A5A8DLP9_CAFRO|nr:hypothetical protein FNF27_07612 [Cafeteria roenbergensis]
MAGPAYCVAKDAFWAWSRPVAAFVDLPDLLALRQVCRAFSGKAGARLLRHHAATVDREAHLAKRMSGASSGIDEDVPAVDALLVRNLRARRLMTPAYGESGVMWGTSPEYYAPDTPSPGPKLFSKFLQCRLVFWLDVGKHIDGAVSAFPERLLLASVHRHWRGVGKSANVQVTVKDRAGEDHSAQIDSVSALTSPHDIGHGLYVAPLANVVVSPDCKATTLRFWHHSGSSCSGSTEAFVLIPLGRAPETPAKPVTLTPVTDDEAAGRTVAAFLEPMIH